MEVAIIKELETVVLIKDIDAHGLKKDNVGIIVHPPTSITTHFIIHHSSLILHPLKTRRREILHVRELTPA